MVDVEILRRRIDALLGYNLRSFARVAAGRL
jgi:hypothetical protein